MAWFYLKLKLLFVLALNCIAIGFALSESEYTERKIAWEKLENEIEEIGVYKSPSPFTIVLLSMKLHNILNAEVAFPNVSASIQAIQGELTNLKSGLTIQQTAHGNMLKFPLNQNLPEILRSEHEALGDLQDKHATAKKLDEVTGAITRVLQFYDSQLDQIVEVDTALCLLFLKGIDDKHGKRFQKQFPLDVFIQNVCDSSQKVSQSASDHCRALSHHWKNRSSGVKSSTEYWKEKSVLQKALNQAENKTFENIGTEQEEIWALLNIQCQMALTLRCEIPYVCERTLLDPTPRSQYLLTHQLLQRILIETVDCSSSSSSSSAVKSFVTTEETYSMLCAKMYMEAKYLDILDVPILYRDLFAEIVGFCGYMGYTNFFRDDWLQRILSWQSKSDSGCFAKDPLYPIGVLSSDMGFKRRATKGELEQGILPNEKCLPHFTAVSLIALAAHWDFLMDLQSK